MNKRSLVAMALFLFGAGAALAQGVRYNFDQNGDFAKNKTYKWVS